CPGSVSALEEGVAESVPQIPKERLVFLLGREVVEDIRKVGKYRRISHELRHSVRRFVKVYGERCSFVSDDQGDAVKDKHTVVSSKTKNSKKVFMLCLQRDAIVRGDELELSPGGSFIKVDIYEPNMKNIDIRQFKWKFKDIYFPYI
ncbi:hypothetical protein Tco_1374318, partial [Tanacetum coccineum]